MDLFTVYIQITVGIARIGIPVARDYSGNDPWNESLTYCPYLASAPTPSLDEYVTLTCDPGFGCLDWCEWTTPKGKCRKTQQQTLLIQPL